MYSFLRKSVNIENAKNIQSMPKWIYNIWKTLSEDGLLGFNHNQLAVWLINNDKQIYCEAASQKGPAVNQSYRWSKESKPGTEVVSECVQVDAGWSSSSHSLWGERRAADQTDESITAISALMINIYGEAMAMNKSDLPRGWGWRWSVCANPPPSSHCALAEARNVFPWQLTSTAAVTPLHR